MKKVWMFAILLVLVSFSGPRSTGEVIGKEVAKIGDRVIDTWDLEYTRTRMNGQGNSDLWLRAVARDRLGAQKAEQSGLPDTSAELKWKLWALEQSIGLDAFLAEITRDATVSEDEVRKYYEENAEQFRKPATFSFHYIFCDTTEAKTPAKVAAIRAEISRVHQQLIDQASGTGGGETSIDLARFQSIGEGCGCSRTPRTQFAGPFSLDEPLQNIIRDAALSLQPGQFSPVVSTKYGYQILRLAEKTEESVISPFEEIKDRIRDHLEAPLKKEKAQSYFLELKSRKDRYTIYPISLEHTLPGAHHSQPESPYVVEVGERKWERSEFKEYMRLVHRRDWIMSHAVEKAIQTTWDKLVLPSLLYEEMQKAGVIDEPTRMAQWRYQRDQMLAYYWVTDAAKRKLAEMPQATTEEYRNYYEKNIQKFTVPERFQIRLFAAPLSATEAAMSPAAREFAYRGVEEKLLPLLHSVIAEPSPDQILETWRAKIEGATQTTEWLYRNEKLAAEVWEKIELGKKGWMDQPYRTSEGVLLIEILDSEESYPRPFDPTAATVKVPVKQEREQRVVQQTWRELEDEAWEQLERSE